MAAPEAKEARKQKLHAWISTLARDTQDAMWPELSEFLISDEVQVSGPSEIVEVWDESAWKVKIQDMFTDKNTTLAGAGDPVLPLIYSGKMKALWGLAKAWVDQVKIQTGKQQVTTMHIVNPNDRETLVIPLEQGAINVMEKGMQSRYKFCPQDKDKPDRKWLAKAVHEIKNFDIQAYDLDKLKSDVKGLQEREPDKSSDSFVLLARYLRRVRIMLDTYILAGLEEWCPPEQTADDGVSKVLPDTFAKKFPQVKVGDKAPFFTAQDKESYLNMILKYAGALDHDALRFTHWVRAELETRRAVARVVADHKANLSLAFGDVAEKYFEEACRRATRSRSPRRDRSRSRARKPERERSRGREKSPKGGKKGKGKEKDPDFKFQPRKINGMIHRAIRFMEGRDGKTTPICDYTNKPGSKGCIKGDSCRNLHVCNAAVEYNSGRWRACGSKDHFNFGHVCGEDL